MKILAVVTLHWQPIRIPRASPLSTVLMTHECAQMFPLIVTLNLHPMKIPRASMSLSLSMTQGCTRILLSSFLASGTTSGLKVLYLLFQRNNAKGVGYHLVKPPHHRYWPHLLLLQQPRKCCRLKQILPHLHP